MSRSGLVSVSFRGRSVPEIVSAAKNAGLSLIEWGSDVHAPFDDTEKLKDIAALCREKGLGIFSYGTYFRVGKDRPEDIRSYIRGAKTLGCRVLRIWAGDKGFSLYSEEEFAAFVSDCREIARIAEEEDVVLCTECHNNTVTDCPEGALALLKAVDSKAFRTYWQPNQLKTVEENLACAAALSEYTVAIHVFNWEGKEKYPLRQAETLWKKYLSLFSDDVVCLLEFMPDGRIESLPEEASALRDILGE